MVAHVTGNNIAKFHDQNQNIKKTTVDLRNALQLISFNQMPGDLKLFLGSVFIVDFFYRKCEVCFYSLANKCCLAQSKNDTCATAYGHKCLHSVYLIDTI